MLDDPGSGSRQGQQIFPFIEKNRSDPLWPAPKLLFNVHRRSFPGLKRQVREVDHNLHLVPRLRMSGAIPLFPLYSFISWTGNTSPYHAGKILIKMGSASKA
jgi:hypothetical protein